MRTVSVNDIREKVSELFIDANYQLGDDLLDAIKRAVERESSPTGKAVLNQLIENAQIASRGEFPLCQDCGVAVVFIEIGQDVHLVDGDLREAINQGVREGYEKGFLRKSMSDVFTRKNTGDNAPAVIHTRITPGEIIKLICVPKGAGSENMSRVTMLTPAQGMEGVKNFVLKTVEESGPNPCPPIVVGVGLGGNFEMASILAKEALLRTIGSSNPQPDLQEPEQELLDEINRLGIGPAGLGGDTTALAVHVKVMPCHIGSLPLAVNINCHSARHREAVI